MTRRKLKLIEHLLYYIIIGRVAIYHDHKILSCDIIKGYNYIFISFYILNIFIILYNLHKYLKDNFYIKYVLKVV